MNAARIVRLALAAALLWSGAIRAVAQIKAEPSSIDLGPRQERQTVATEVRLTNAGTKPLEILAVRPDCSCTAGALEKTKLAPGEAATLRLSIETRGYQGVLHRNVRIVSTENELTLPITLSVSPFKAWAMEPTTLVLPASLKGQEASRAVTLKYTGSGEATPGPVTCDAPWLHAEVSAPAGKSWRITFVKEASAPAGNHSVKVSVATTVPDEPTLSFTVFVPVASTLKLSPNPLVLPTVKVGQSSSRELVIQGWPSETSPRLELPRGSTRLLGHEGDRWQFEISASSARPGPLTQLLRIYSGDSLEAELPVILRAEPDDTPKNN